MMKRLFHPQFVLSFLSCILLAQCSHKSMDVSCIKFHKGKFSYKANSDGSEYTIIRDDSIQVEVNNANGRMIRSKIKWQTPCKFEMYFLDRNFTGEDSLLSIVKSRPLKVEIIKANKDFCVFKATLDGITNVVIDTLTIQR